MEQKSEPRASLDVKSWTRRKLLASAAIAAAGAVVLADYRPAAAQVADSDAFLSLARLLTVRANLNAGIVARAFDCLAAEDGGFAEKAKALRQAVGQAKLVDMTKFEAFVSGQPPEMRETAMKIISSLYLGYTGTPAMDSTVDDARFVSYADALMYQPTIDVTVIPSFARGHTNYWIDPPSSIATD